MGGLDKTFADLLGVPVVARSVEGILACRAVVSLVLALPASSLAQGKALARARGWGARVHLCEGGSRRQDSVHRGLETLAAAGGCEWVVVHDGARPCVTPDLVDVGLKVAQTTGAAIAVVPLSDTVKQVDAEGFVIQTPPRDQLRAVQTPQVFRYQLLVEAHRAARHDVTDDAALVEAIGGRVRTFPGAPENIKVTVPADLALAEAILRRRAVRREACSG
jgi:2-C-methyl-D-erythritol 4-phosphate cytidylyltransferase